MLCVKRFSPFFPSADKKVKRKAVAKKPVSEKREKITLECTNPVTDGIMDTAALEKWVPACVCRCCC